MMFCYVLEKWTFGDDNTNCKQTCTCIYNVLACTVWMHIVLNMQVESLINYAK